MFKLCADEVQKSSAAKYSAERKKWKHRKRKSNKAYNFHDINNYCLRIYYLDCKIMKLTLARFWHFRRSLNLMVVLFNHFECQFILLFFPDNISFFFCFALVFVLLFKLGFMRLLSFGFRSDDNGKYTRTQKDCQLLFCLCAFSLHRCVCNQFNVF